MRLAVLIVFAGVMGGCAAAPAAQSRFVFHARDDGIATVRAAAAVDWRDIRFRLADCMPRHFSGPMTIRVGAFAPFTRQRGQATGAALNDPATPGFCEPGSNITIGNGEVTTDDWLGFCASPGADHVQIEVWNDRTGAHQVLAFVPALPTCE